jgi:hypothetical protein
MALAREARIQSIAHKALVTLHKAGIAHNDALLDEYEMEASNPRDFESVGEYKRWLKRKK